MVSPACSGSKKCFAGLKRDGVLSLDLDLFAGPRVPTHTRLAIRGLEGAKPDQGKMGTSINI